ncbi:MAG: hypothetical protein Q9168_002328 [Polycauliona sp. 1 TL-2023]
MDNLFSAFVKAVAKAKAQAGLCGVINQQCRSSESLPSAMIIDQTQASRSDTTTTLMGQIYGDIESARMTRQADVRLQGRLSSLLSSEDRIVQEVLVESNVTGNRAIRVPTSVSSEISHVCKKFASVKSAHGWMILSILAHSESFRNACRTFDTPLWDQLMHDIGQNHVSLELFFKVRGLDWATPLRSVAHLIPHAELQSYLQCQEKRELQDIFLQTPHSYVVPKADGILQRPHYESILHLYTAANVFNSKAFSEDPSICAPTGGACENCGQSFCDCEPSKCEKITRPLTELVHCAADKGIGVRTLQRIRAGDVLDEYVGELKRASTVTDQTYAMELEGLPAGHQSRNDYNPILIDSQVYGNWTRYINASCNPSLKFAPAIIGGKHRIMIVAIRDINSFEELTIGYGDNYWLGSDTKMCSCNEETCRHATMAQKEKARWGCAVAFQEAQQANSARRVVLDADAMDMESTSSYGNNKPNAHNKAGKHQKKSGHPSNPAHHSSPRQHTGAAAPSHNQQHGRSRHTGGTRPPRNIPGANAQITWRTEV